MSQYNLERIFKPRRVAVVGASEKTGGIGEDPPDMAMTSEEDLGNAMPDP